MVLVVAALFLAGGVLHARLVRRVWRDPSRAEELVDAFAVLPYGAEFRRCMVRAQPANTGVVLCVALFVIAGDLGVSHPGGVLGRVLYWASAVFLVSLLAFILLGLCVTFLNFPKFLVPPHMRGEPGFLVAGWRRRKDRAGAVAAPGSGDRA